MTNNLHIQFPAPLNACFLPFWSLVCYPLMLYWKKNEFFPSHVLSSLFKKSQKPLFTCLAHHSLYRIYINPSTCNRIFIILDNFLDLMKCFRNYGEAITKWPNYAKLISRIKNECTWGNIISTVTGVLTLRLKCNMYKGAISQPVRGFFQIIHFGWVNTCLKTSQIRYTAS